MRPILSQGAVRRRPANRTADKSARGPSVTPSVGHPRKRSSHGGSDRIGLQTGRPRRAISRLASLTASLAIDDETKFHREPFNARSTFEQGTRPARKKSKDSAEKKQTETETETNFIAHPLTSYAGRIGKQRDIKNIRKKLRAKKPIVENITFA